MPEVPSSLSDPIAEPPVVAKQALIAPLWHTADRGIDSINSLQDRRSLTELRALAGVQWGIVLEARGRLSFILIMKGLDS